MHFNLTVITECVRIFFMHSETTSLKRMTVTQSILIYALVLTELESRTAQFTIVSHCNLIPNHDSDSNPFLVVEEILPDLPELAHKFCLPFLLV